MPTLCQVFHWEVKSMKNNSISEIDHLGWSRGSCVVYSPWGMTVSSWLVAPTSITRNRRSGHVYPGEFVKVGKCGRDSYKKISINYREMIWIMTLQICSSVNPKGWIDVRGIRISNNMKPLFVEICFLPLLFISCKALQFFNASKDTIHIF